MKSFFNVCGLVWGMVLFFLGQKNLNLVVASVSVLQFGQYT